jgi:hypothetical protein
MFVLRVFAQISYSQLLKKVEERESVVKKTLVFPPIGEFTIEIGGILLN